MYYREDTIEVNVGNLIIGGSNQVLLQSMTNTKTSDAKATIEQVGLLAAAGAALVRVAVPDSQALQALPEIVSKSTVPIVADIHFDYKLALGAIEAGVAKLRINPGNIGSQERVKQIIALAKKKGTAIRVGVNMGSIGEAENKVKYALQVLDEYISFFKENKFHALVISLKASDVTTNLELNKKYAKNYKYPLHLGVTEAGFGTDAIVRSSVGIGSLLLKGLGNTVRVSVAGNPLQELPIAKAILQSVGLLENAVEIIACPTCGRTSLDTEKVAREVKEKTKDLGRKLKIAVMGCEVNGPGEAADADYGICGSKKQGIIFAKGKIVKKVPMENVVDELLKMVNGEE